MSVGTGATAGVEAGSGAGTSVTVGTGAGAGTVAGAGVFVTTTVSNGAGAGLAGAGAFVTVTVATGAGAGLATGAAAGAGAFVTVCDGAVARVTVVVETAAGGGVGLGFGTGAGLGGAAGVLVTVRDGAFVKIVGGSVFFTVTTGLAAAFVCVIAGGVAAGAGGVSAFFGEVNVATSLPRPDSSMAEAGGGAFVSGLDCSLARAAGRWCGCQPRSSGMDGPLVFVSLSPTNVAEALRSAMIRSSAFSLRNWRMISSSLSPDALAEASRLLASVSWVMTAS